jgi:hypothetical protein
VVDAGKLLVPFLKPKVYWRTSSTLAKVTAATPTVAVFLFS